MHLQNHQMFDHILHLLSKTHLHQKQNRQYYTLYHYLDDDIIIVNLETDSEWQEVLQASWGWDTSENSSIEFEVLDNDLYNQELKTQ